MTTKISNKEIAAKLTSICLLFGFLLFASAGNLDWPEAWLFLIIYLALAIPGVLWLKKNNPELLKERLNFLKTPSQNWDKIIMLLATLLFIVMFLLAGFDAIRYQLSKTPFVLKLLGFVGLFLSFALIFSVARENPYLSRVIEIQKNKGHSVITTGPYKYVRHPMYVGTIVFYLCIPLALGSLYALIPGFLLTILVIIRTHLEDKTLHNELPGYKEYAASVKYRLIPGVW
jgi:protein-S-isoprenylcysteine O-methyltransferase Ste14